MHKSILLKCYAEDTRVFQGVQCGLCEMLGRTAPSILELKVCSDEHQTEPRKSVQFFSVASV